MIINPLLTAIVASTLASASMTPEVGTRVYRAGGPSQDEVQIHFGFGATYMVGLNAGVLSMDGLMLSEFSVSWAPMGLTGEVGVDVAINREIGFFVRPNLKFFFVKHSAFSMFMEATAAWWSHAEGADWGGGGSVGMMSGVMKHLAVEVRGSLLAFADGAGPIQQIDQPVNGEKQDIRLMPSVSLRMLARF